jgi:hypothetical protein
MIEEPLQLLPRKRPVARPPFIVGQVHDRVPLVADLHRVGPEALLALDQPAVARVGHEVAKLPQRSLVAAHRRPCQLLLAGQLGHPLVDVGGLPVPRVVVGERREPADHLRTAVDRLGPQPPRGLLRPPAAQHRLQHRVLGVQQRHALDQLQARPALQIALLRHPLSPSR